MAIIVPKLTVEFLVMRIKYEISTVRPRQKI